MRNPFEVVRDLYDFELPRFKWYIHRRLLFSGQDKDQEKWYKPRYFIYNDQDDTEKLITGGALLGSMMGISYFDFDHFK